MTLTASGTQLKLRLRVCSKQCSGVAYVQQHNCEPELIAKLEVWTRSAVTHTVTPKRLHQWFQGRAKNPKEAVMKQGLRELVG